EAHGELLNFALVVVADKYFRIVAYVIVHARGPLPVVLSENFGLHVVVSAGGVRVCIGHRKQLHQRLHIGVDTVRATRREGRDLAAREDRLIHLSWWKP